jgi:site-specific recombinase XerD
MWEISRDKFLSKEEAKQLISRCEEKAALDKMKGRKTWVKRFMLVDLVFYSGLRVREVSLLQIRDLRFRKGENQIFIAKGKGKGGKTGCITIDNKLSSHLKDFIRDKALWNESITPESYLLCPKDGEAYTRRALQKSFKEALKEAGLPSYFSIHCARHTYATNLLAACGNLRLVQKQLRHSNIATTAVYADILDPQIVTRAVEGMRESL